jgi:polyhydroxybutyrate depolymerase
MLHGLGSSSESIERYSDWPTFAEQNGIAWAAPDGPFDRRGRRFWNAGPSCCNFDQLQVDHVAALGELIGRLARDPRVDPQRVYVGGYSNGGFMAHRLACERPELVAGIVSIAGSAPLDGRSCKTPTSLRVLQVQGEADPIVTYGGGHLFQDPRLPEHASAQQTLRSWAERLGCRGEPRVLPAVDFEAALPGSETRVSSYQGCAHGAVALWTVTAGQHMIGFRTPAPGAIWGALER